jgi:hypothetical protein
LSWLDFGLSTAEVDPPAHGVGINIPFQHTLSTYS